jgi:hypothetical protein
VLKWIHQLFVEKHCTWLSTSSARQLTVASMMTTELFSSSPVRRSVTRSACEKNTNFKKSKVLQIAEVQAHLFVAKNYFFFVSIYAESRLPQDRTARSGLLFGVRVFTYSK